MTCPHPPHPDTHYRRRDGRLLWGCRECRKAENRRKRAAWTPDIRKAHNRKYDARRTHARSHPAPVG